jgi:hypothetical protein
VNEHDRSTAGGVRALLERGAFDAQAFRVALERVDSVDRDAWVDVALGFPSPPDDGPALPRGGVPYLPCPVDTLLRVIDEAPVDDGDVFVDIGAGIGRAVAIVSLLTGARSLGIEAQPQLVGVARERIAGLGLGGVTMVTGDAAELPAGAAGGSVFFLCCPFSGDRLSALLARLELVARVRTIRLCCVDLPLPARPWFDPMGSTAGSLVIYRSR